jgi:hypothetical protein
MCVSRARTISWYNVGFSYEALNINTSCLLVTRHDSYFLIIFSFANQRLACTLRNVRSYMRKVFHLHCYYPLWWAKSLVALSQVFSPASCPLTAAAACLPTVYLQQFTASSGLAKNRFQKQEDSTPNQIRRQPLTRHFSSTASYFSLLPHIFNVQMLYAEVCLRSCVVITVS